MTITITLPPPPKAAHPNSRAHWAAKARVVKKAREDAHLAALAAVNEHEFVFPDGVVYVQTTLYVRDKRGLRADGDNVLAACKAYYDGIQDAGLVANDNQLRHAPCRIAVDSDARIEITLSTVPHA